MLEVRRQRRKDGKGIIIACECFKGFRKLRKTCDATVGAGQIHQGRG
jgi:hypothetical protein